MKHIIISLAAAALCTLSFAQEKYTNPVIKGNLADPTLLKVGDNYYTSGTSGDVTPHYPIFKSNDLVNWEQVGNVFDKKPEWTKGAFWAPEMWEHNGKFYVYYTAKRASDGISCIGVGISDKPEGPYEDKGIIIEWGIEAIDAFIIEDNGEQYILWKAYGLDKRPIELLACKLSKDGLKLDGEVFSVLKDDEGLLCEGQQWFKHGDWYYILYAIRDCCSAKSDYAVSVARSKSLKGPYEKYSGNPILEGFGPIQSLGHGTGVWTDDGRFFYLCHAFFKGEEFKLGRQPVLYEMVINDEGWMVCKSGKKATLSLPVPFKAVVQKPYNGFEDKFDNMTLNPAWIWSLRSGSPDYVLSSGKLKLTGQMNVRNRTLNYEFESSLKADKKAFAGISFSSGRSQYRLGSVGKETVLEKFTFGGEKENIASVKTRGCAFKFKIKKNTVEAYYSTNGEKWTLLTSFDKADSNAGNPGIFSEGEAEFDYFSMKPGI